MDSSPRHAFTRSFCKTARGKHRVACLSTGKVSMADATLRPRYETPARAPFVCEYWTVLGLPVARLGRSDESDACRPKRECPRAGRRPRLADQLLDPE